ncbi:MAG TPA: nuclear transport factor 2 family protein, partial [Vicinamibacterales bacterium]
ADRAFSSSAAKKDLVDALAPMFADEVAMPSPTGVVYGAQKAVEAIRANPANAGTKVEWTPARVGISGDGRHGFTAGFMTVHRPDGTTVPAKYMSYWEKQGNAWRVVAYKRAPAKVAAPAIPTGYVLPRQIVASSTDAAAIGRARESLADAERSFSKDAQTMGIGPAFKKYGSPDAANFGGPDTPTFVFGNEAIGDQVGQNAPPNTSPVNWGPEKTIIASSGDFGVTIGYIVRNHPAPDGKIPPGQPFFTIWKKDATGAWRYIAE